MTGDGDRLDERCSTGACSCLCHGPFGMAVSHFAPCCYPSGSIGAMFPEAAKMTEALLAERNALEVQLRDAQAENERLRLNDDAAAVAMTGPLYSDVESTAQQLHDAGERKAAKQIRMVLAQIRVAQRVASEFDQMVAELAAERAKVQRALDVGLIRRAVADPGQFLPRGANYTEGLHAWQARAVRAALTGGEQGE